MLYIIYEYITLYIIYYRKSEPLDGWKKSFRKASAKPVLAKRRFRNEKCIFLLGARTLPQKGRSFRGHKNEYQIHETAMKHNDVTIKIN